MRKPWFNSPGVHWVLFMGLLCALVNRAAADSAQVGNFEWKLTSHSASSTAEELCKRYGYQPGEISNVYDFNSAQLLVHVPADYNPAKPPGLLVILTDPQPASLDAALNPILDSLHLICVVPTSFSGDDPSRTAFLLDIANNLQSKYTLDKRRLYFLSTLEEDHFMPFTAMDVYTGYINASKFIMYGKTKLLDRRYVGFFTPHDSHTPSAAMLADAKRRGWVFVTDPELAANDTFGKLYRRSFVAQLGSEGYSHVQMIDVQTDQAKYSHFDAWLGRAIRFLDSSQPSASGADSPSSGSANQPASPSPDAAVEAGRLLKVAKLYLDAGKKDLAKAKLNAIIAKYPTDPAAATAKKLLAQIDAG